MTTKRPFRKREPIKVLCVDDHAFVVEGLTARLEIEDDMEVVGCLSSAAELVDEVERTNASIVLLDIEMPGPDPFEAIERLRQLHPEVRSILLSAFIRDRYIDAAYRVGAWGYLSKSDTSDSVIEGIRSVAHGELVFSDAVRSRSQLDEPGHETAESKLSLLTSREREILRMIARGMSRTTIATELSRSPMTIDNHRKSIMRKLDIHDKTELIRYALAEGLVEL